MGIQEQTASFKEKRESLGRTPRNQAGDWGGTEPWLIKAVGDYVSVEEQLNGNYPLNLSMVNPDKIMATESKPSVMGRLRAPEKPGRMLKPVASGQIPVGKDN